MYHWIAEDTLFEYDEKHIRYGAHGDDISTQSCLGEASEYLQGIAESDVFAPSVRQYLEAVADAWFDGYAHELSLDTAPGYWL